MSLLLAHPSKLKPNQGFTMVEILIIIIIVGVLSAIAAPAFLGVLNRNKITDAASKMRGALQEAQREAMRKSKNCGVTITVMSPQVTGSTVTGTDGEVTSSTGCLVTGSRTFKGISLAQNGNSGVNPWTITFDYKGRTTNSGTITFSLPDSTANRRCIVLSNGIGLIRAGTYDGSSCTTSQL